MKTKKIFCYLMIFLFILSFIPVNIVSASPLTVTTNAAIGIEETNATLSGTLTDNNSATASVGFQYGTTTSYGNWINLSLGGPLTYYNLSEHLNWSNNDDGDDGVSGRMLYAQTFTIGTNGSNESLLLYNASVYGYPAFGNPLYINVSINYTNASGFPTACAIANGSFLCTNIGDSWNNIILNSTAPTIKGTKYALILYNYTADNNHRFQWDYHYGAGTYAGGCEICSSDNGTSWYIMSAISLFFKLYFNNTLPATPLASGTTFTNNTTSLSPGTVYHYKSTANTTNGSFANGSDVTFLTKPEAPLTLGVTSAYPNSQVYFDKSPTANNTIIRAKLGSFPASPTGDVLIYNGTDVFPAPPILHGPLTQGQIWYYRAWSWSNCSGWNVYSDDYISDGPIYIYASPQVTTNASTGVEETNATLKGYLANNGSVYLIGLPDVTCRFQYGLTTAYGTTTADQIKTTPITFDQNVLGLAPGTFYHFRAVASNWNGTVYGSDMTFLTKPNAPTGSTSTNSTVSHTINISWTAGTGANNTTIVRKATGYPTSISDGTIVYNGTNSFYNDTFASPPTTLYYGLWSYTGNSTLFQISDASGQTLQFLLWTTAPSVTTNASTSIATDSATLNGYLADDGNESTKCTFAYGSTIALESNSTSTYATKGTIISTAIGSLTHATLYFNKLRGSNSNSTTNGSVQKFLTLPYNPTGFTVTATTGSNISIDWNNDTNSTGYNQSIILRYSTSGYPSSITGADGSTLATIWPSPLPSNFTVESLSPGTKYYFSIWTALNVSGVFANSSSYGTTSGSTPGGMYNFSLFYENLSIVDNTTALNKSSIFLYGPNGEIINSTYGLTFYSFNMLASNDVYSVKLFYNNSQYYRGYVPQQLGNLTIKMYVSNRSIIGETYALPGYNYTSWSTYVLPYEISFIDHTLMQQYISNPSTVFFLYLYNGSNPYNIHMDTLSALKTIKVSLDYGKVYRAGIMNSNGFVLLGTIQPGSSSTFTITIESQQNITYQIEEFITLSTSNDSTGIYLNLTDTSLGTNSINITFYEISNTTSTYAFSTNILGAPFSYKWVTADGADLQKSYRIVVNISHTLFTTNQTMYTNFIPNFIIGKIIANDFDARMNAIFPSPGGIPWSYWISFSIFFICLIAFKSINTEIGIMFGSSVMIFFNFVIFYSPLLQGLPIIAAGLSFGFALISLVDKEKRGIHL